MPRVLRNQKCLPEHATVDQNEPQKKRNKRVKPPAETKPQSSGSSSESDIESYLKKPEDLDLNSTFFQSSEPQPKPFDLIEKDIFNGINRLSDSNSESEPEPEEDVRNETHKEIRPIDPETNVAPFRHLHEYNERLKNARKHVDEYNAKTKSCEQDVDVSNILSVGETKDAETHDLYSGLHSSDFESCSESGNDDWEEVKTGEIEEKQCSKNGVEITLREPNVVRTKKHIDLMAAFKRRMNKIKKENQTYVHKVHVLCWIAHGNYVNGVLSHESLLGLSLSLLPSQHCYPSNRVDLAYLESILQWYKKAVKIVKVDGGGNDCLEKHLEKQIVAKEASNYKHLVYIFICILRSMGLKCRLVISLQVEPLRPPISELCSLSKNDAKEKEIKKSSKNTSHNKVPRESKKLKLAEEIIPTQTAKSNGETKGGKNNDEIETEIVGADAKAKAVVNGSKKGHKTTKIANIKKSNKILKNPTNETSHVKPSTSGTQPVDQRETQTCENTKVKNKSRSLDNNPPNNKEKLRKQSKNSFKVKVPFKTKHDKEPDVPFEDMSTDLKASEIKKLKRRDSESSNDNCVIPQLDGGNDTDSSSNGPKSKKPNISKLTLQSKNSCVKSHPKRLKMLHRRSVNDSDDEFHPRSPLTKKNNQFTLATNVKEMIVDIQASSSQINHPRRKVNLKLLSKDSNLKEAIDRKPFSKDDNSKKTIGRSDAQPSTHNLRKRINLKCLSRETTSRNCSSDQIDVRDDIVTLIKKDITVKGLKLKHKRKSGECSDVDSDYTPELRNKNIKDNSVKIKRRVPMKKDLAEIEKKNMERKLEEKKNKDVNVWIEVFSEAEEKWISVDVVKGQIHCVKELYNRATRPISYVLAWDNDNYVKDITKRYCVNWNTVTRKLRCDPTWLDATLKPFLGPKTFRDREEDDELATQQLEQPLPTTISEYKNHPLYVLKRHLLKFEAIYPPNALTLGFVRNEPVYSRDCVYVLHSRDLWLKHAKVVKLGETPYKIVKARPKYDKLSNSMITDKLLEIFGKWQVQDYEPPTAENGIVPRNAYGNVELFKPCMLPKGTVHLQLPGLNKVARKLNVDCAPAMIGFDFHSGWNHPTFDGFIVCKEHEEILIAGWYMEQEEAEKRAEEKLEKRVYGNWRRLIKGLLIRERLKARYDFGYESKGATNKTKSSGYRLCLKKRRVCSDSDSDVGKN